MCGLEQAGIPSRNAVTKPYSLSIKAGTFSLSKKKVVDY